MEYGYNLIKERYMESFKKKKKEKIYTLDAERKGGNETDWKL